MRIDIEKTLEMEGVVDTDLTAEGDGRRGLSDDNVLQFSSELDIVLLDKYHTLGNSITHLQHGSRRYYTTSE